MKDIAENIFIFHRPYTDVMVTGNVQSNICVHAKSSALALMNVLYTLYRGCQTMQQFNEGTEGIRLVMFCTVRGSKHFTYSQ